MAEEFKGEFECLWENTEKNIRFSVPLKNDNDNKITYKIKFVHSCRFIPSKLSDLVDNLPEINNKDCETCMEGRKLNHNVNLLDLETIDWISDAKNAK